MVKQLLSRVILKKSGAEIVKCSRVLELGGEGGFAQSKLFFVAEPLDGRPSALRDLFDEADLAIQEHLLALSRLSPQLLGRFGRTLAAWAGEERDANIEELALSAGISQRAASSFVTALVEAGICERVDGDRIHPLGDLDSEELSTESLTDQRVPREVLDGIETPHFDDADSIDIRVADPSLHGELNRLADDSSDFAISPLTR